MWEVWERTEKREMEGKTEKRMEPKLGFEVKTMDHIEGTHQGISYATYM